MAAIPVGTATPEQLEQVVGSSTIPYFLGTMALQPPPAIGAFLIGFAAKRASWLGGLIYGIFVTIVAIVVLQTPAGRLLTGDGSAEAVIVGHAAWSPVGAALFASAAAWYRRFLDLANPNRPGPAAGAQGEAEARSLIARSGPATGRSPATGDFATARGHANPSTAATRRRGRRVSPRSRRPRNGSSGRTGVAALGARRVRRQRLSSSPRCRPHSPSCGDPPRSPHARLPGLAAS